MPSIDHLTYDEILAMTSQEIADLRWTGEEYSVGVGQWDEKTGSMTGKSVVTYLVIGDKKTGSALWGFTYYPNGDVDEITERTLDAADKETRRVVVKHFQDGRPPVATETAPGLEPEPGPGP